MGGVTKGWAVAGSIVCGLAALLSAHTARAGIGACGDIEVSASAQCEVVPPSVDCAGMCKPVAVRAACAAQLGADCRGECPELPSAKCSGDCSGSCQADCDKLEAGTFDCQGACGADCSGRCSADCKAEDDPAACEASCNGSCSASCDVSCKGQPPKVDCDAGCDASCKGSCEADANFDCQLKCQGKGEADCSADVEGGCKLACKGTDGALFCDGQYVDTGDNLQACIDALRAALDIQVEGKAEAHSECAGGDGCRAAGRATATVSSGCSVIRPGGKRCELSQVLGVSGLAVLAGLRRRRRHV